MRHKVQDGGRIDWQSLNNPRATYPTHTSDVRKTSIAVYVLALLPGLWVLNQSIGLVQLAFTWPQEYSGPGVTGEGPPPDDYFTGARIVTVLMLLVALGYLTATVALYLSERRRAHEELSYNIPVVLFLLACGMFLVFCPALASFISTYTD